MARARVVSIYPDLLGTYGDRGNALMLAGALRRSGYDTTLSEVPSTDRLPEAEFYVLGGGEDGPQALAVDRLRHDGALVEAVAGRSVVLAVCAGFQLLGERFPSAGAMVAGLGCLPFWTEAGLSRAVGEIRGEATIGIAQSYVSGFENHAGRTTLDRSLHPFLHVRSGVGNDEESRVDGVVAGATVGTYLHGPVLARNPGLLVYLLRRFDPQFELDPVLEALGRDLLRERLDTGKI
ncbi:MAG: type 1 glutamine amidotransferase [Ferrimicrobium sp.]